MNILITGSSGYLADFFIKEFLKDSHNILTISINNPFRDAKALNINELNSKFAIQSLNNFKPTHVIHFAGLAHKIFSSNDTCN